MDAVFDIMDVIGAGRGDDVLGGIQAGTTGGIGIGVEFVLCPLFQ